MANIVTAPSGSNLPDNFTPGAVYTLQHAAALINASWNQANDKYSAFETKIGNISTTWLDTATAPHITAASAAVPTITEPMVTIPSAIDISDINTNFSTQYNALVTLLAGKFTDFRTAYFPDEQATYAAAESWLADAIANPNNAIPVAVANQLISQDRDKAMAEATRAADSVISVFAARRFPLPPGAAVSAILQIQQTSQDNMAESSRRLTTQSLDMMKFVIDKAINLRQIALGATVDYIKALASGPEIASHIVGIGYDAQSKLISAVSQYYGARSEAAKVISSVNQFNASATQSASEKNQMADLTLIEDRLKALLVEAQALAQMATAMYNNLHASAGTSYSVSV